jgi:hypothetical protein
MTSNKTGALCFAVPAEGGCGKVRQVRQRGGTLDCRTPPLSLGEGGGYGNASGGGQRKKEPRSGKQAGEEKETVMQVHRALVNFSPKKEVCK